MSEGNDVPFRERPLPEVQRLLAESLGQQTVLFAVEGMPDIEADKTLRDMAEIVERAQQQGIDSETLEGLMFGSSQALDDEAPIHLIRQGESKRVLAITPGFLEGYQ